MSAENKPTFSIAVTGETGLSGSTTISNRLAEYYVLKRVGAGNLRRKLAQDWQSYQEQGKSWVDFLNDLESNSILSNTSDEESFSSEEALVDFNQRMKSAPSDLIIKLDRLTDEHTAQALMRGNVIADGKVTILIGKKIYPDCKADHPIIRILVFAPPLNKRVERLELRQGIKLSTLAERHHIKNHLNLRHRTDWQRYFLLHGIIPEDLLSLENIIEIDGDREIEDIIPELIEKIDCILANNHNQ